MGTEVKITNKYRFHIGEIVSKDAIYLVMGLGGGDWWENVDGDDMAENVVITKDVRIDIIITKGGQE